MKKSLQASFKQGLHEGWTMFWAPFTFIARQLRKVFSH